MSHPVPANPEEAAALRTELHHQTYWALEDAVPQGADRIDFRLVATGGYTDAALTVTMPDGSHPAVAPPQESIDLLLRIRALDYTPGKGTWFSARYVVFPGRDVAAKFNYSCDPRWDPPVPAEAWARDLAEFLRDDAYIPDWLRARLAGDEPNFGPTNPVGGMSVEDQRQVYAGEMLTLIADSAPPDWVEIMGNYRAVGDHSELPVTVREADGTLHVWTPPPQLGHLFDRLRAGMYYWYDEEHEHGRGTWSEAAFTVTFGNPMNIDLRYLWDDEPRWETEPSADDVRKEMERLPRAEGTYPEWMLARAGLDASPEAGSRDEEPPAPSSGG